MATLVEHGHDLSGTTAQRPTNVEPGQRYFDTTLNRQLVWNGTAWQPDGTVSVNHVYNAPADTPFFVADRAYKVLSIRGRVAVVGSDGGAVTAEIRKAPSGTAPGSGTILHTGTLNLKGTANANQSLTLSSTAADLLLASGDSLIIDVSGTTTAATGVVSVLLLPQ